MRDTQTDLFTCHEDIGQIFLFFLKFYAENVIFISNCTLIVHIFEILCTTLVQFCYLCTRNHNT